MRCLRNRRSNTSVEHFCNFRKDAHTLKTSQSDKLFRVPGFTVYYSSITSSRENRLGGLSQMTRDMVMKLHASALSRCFVDQLPCERKSSGRRLSHSLEHNCNVM